MMSRRDPNALSVIGALNAGTLIILDDLGNVNEVGLLQPSNQ